MKKIFILILSISIIAGCEKIFFEDDPENTPDNNFEIFWTDFDRYYAQFNIRNIDWDSIYTVYKPQISSNISDRQLFNILSEIHTSTAIGNDCWRYERWWYWKSNFSRIAKWLDISLINQICSYS